MILMNGQELKKKKLQQLKEKVQKLDTIPGLCVINVNTNLESEIYTRNKKALATSLGYHFENSILCGDINEELLIQTIKNFNNDDRIDGIIIDMPLPEHLDIKKVLNSIDSSKDIDGVTYNNIGKLVSKEPCLIPSTPKAIIDLLDYYNIPLRGENVVIIGRSLIVGKPIAHILINRDATITLCHSKTLNLEYYTRNADIIIVAVGKKDFLKSNMISSGAVVIDVGINSINDKIYGDVDFNDVSKKVGYITPVPGGIGPLTVYELMENTYNAHVLRLGKK